jgi:hypothetical protein
LGQSAARNAPALSRVAVKSDIVWFILMFAIDLLADWTEQEAVLIKKSSGPVGQVQVTMSKFQ